MVRNIDVDVEEDFGSEHDHMVEKDVPCVTFTPDDMNSIEFLDTELGEVQEVIDRWGVTAIKFSRDGKLLLQTKETVEIWRQRDEWELDRKIDLPGSFETFAVSSDDRLIALAEADSTIQVVETGKGVLVQTLGGHMDRVDNLAFSSDSRFLVSSGTDNLIDKTIKVWSIVPEKLDEAPFEQRKSIKEVAPLRMAPDS
ncbi:hypothetical protein AtubIFM57258_004554 [Aspergillus tubingensis]|nr:hypothetical protein AtubIFM57258_004554 [Aspergillus tubingensis]